MKIFKNYILKFIAQPNLYVIIKIMKSDITDKRLFWFLKEGTQLDLTEPSILDMYVQQVITMGSAENVRMLLKTLKLGQLQDALRRLRRFIPGEVRRFWEDFIGDNK